MDRPGAARVPGHFNLIAWSDRTGDQQIKWTTGKGITPFINLHEARLAYFDDLERARLLRTADETAPRRGVAVIRSPNTGETLTTFWKTLPYGSSPPLSRLSGPS